MDKAGVLARVELAELPELARQLIEGPPTEQLPITESVKQLERRCIAVESILGEVLATLLLEGNAHLFADFPEHWGALVESWQRRFQESKCLSG